MSLLSCLSPFQTKATCVPSGEKRPPGVVHGAFRDRKTWAERRAEEQAKLGYEEQPYVLIVGGGQGAIGLGARLKRLAGRSRIQVNRLDAAVAAQNAKNPIA